MAASTSLVLHLREVRYYPLLVLLVAAIVAVELRTAVLARASAARRCALLVPLLVALFLTFHPAWAATAAALAVEALLRARREARGAAPRARVFLRQLAPVLASLLAVVPLAGFFEIARISSRFSEQFELGVRVYLENLGSVAEFLFLHAALGPALVVRAGLALTLQRRGARARDPARARASSALLWRFALVYCALVAANPILFERYFLPALPALAGALLLDASRWLRVADTGARARAVVAATLAACAAFFAVLQAPFLADRWQELRQPYRGPLDFAIAFLRESYADPASLVIATNYEACSLMYYLGSRVVGDNLNANPDQDLRQRFDVVLPRKWYRETARRLEPALRGRGWRRQRLPVSDLPYNNVPSLAPMGGNVPVLHLSRTPVPQDESGWLELYWRPQGP
jgi:hypothetical protein